MRPNGIVDGGVEHESLRAMMAQLSGQRREPMDKQKLGSSIQINNSERSTYTKNWNNI